MAVGKTLPQGHPSSRDTAHYTGVAKALHWAIALLILCQFSLAFYMDGLPLGMEKYTAFNWHKTVGLSILTLVLLRILWRVIHRPPALPQGMKGWEILASHITHLLLYGLMLGVPLSGLLGAFASGLPTLLFNSFTLTSPIAADRALQDLAFSVHENLALFMLLLIGLHIGAALRHHFLIKDDVLTRMLPGGRK